MQPDKPLMVAEFWPGWFDHWGEQHHKMEVKKVVQRVSNILRAGASINFYMFHGRLDTNSLIQWPDPRSPHFPLCSVSPFDIFQLDFRRAWNRLSLYEILKHYSVWFCANNSVGKGRLVVTTSSCYTVSHYTAVLIATIIIMMILYS